MFLGTLSLQQRTTRVSCVAILAAILMTACSSSANRPEKAIANTVVAATDDHIAITGRVERLSEGALRFAFPGVSLKFNFSGNSLHLFASSSSGNTYLDVMVDGKPHLVQIPETPTRIEIFSAAKNSKHHIEIINRSETWHGITTLASIELGQGQLLAKPSLSSRKILVIGDSITCGEAIEPPKTCGTKENSWWNPRLSYGMLLAAEVDAQVHMVCMGGRGLIRNWNGTTTDENAPEFYDLAIVDGSNSVAWPQKNYNPDLVYIALGTNDFSSHAGPMPSEKQYVLPYVDFVNKILSDHPNAQVVLTEGPMLGGEEKPTLVDYLEKTKIRVGSDQVHVLEATRYPGGPCDFHPGKAEHAAMAADIIPPIKHIMGW